ncbi:MAG: toprim domain-containing protein [Deltaproteobacteria bacterium]|nr:toprim domain-containing protein [Deltaproteobacteria bacterium]
MKIQNFSSRGVKAASQGRWSEILAAANIHVSLNQHQPCPACGGKDRFRYDDRHGNGDYYCNKCEPGDGLALIMKTNGWGFDETLTFVAGVIGFSFGKEVNTVSPTRNKPFKAKPTFSADSPNSYALKEIQRIRNTATTDTDRIQKYYLHRGIGCTLSSSYNRFLASEKEPETGKFYPCSVYPIRTANGEVLGYQKIFLDDKSDGKAPVSNPKRMTQKIYDGSYTGCSVWLAKPDGKLLIVEGVESGLAVALMTGEAVWCSLTSSMMKNLIVPSYVKVVEIWADNDENKTGEHAAQILCDRLKSEGRLCRVVLPPTVGDWLDVLNNKKAVA